MSGKTVRRCAIYTRKSTDDGLDQAFNSLHAQREACSAFIASQAGLGWKELPEEYDDGGISGGTMDRPALARLLAEIRAGRVNVVVVYKIDRLTRSLADFARMVELFETHEVAFVSVTQQFNTTSSMGRLTLNVLLSFAQFEREVTAERIRDKIAASRRKGLWMGGSVPYGYKAIDKKLVPCEPHAPIVRHIFERYIDLKSVRALAAELQTAPPAGFDRPVHKGWLYHLLANPVYIGLVRHKRRTFDGMHDAIIDQELFTQAQQVRTEQRQTTLARARQQRTHLLTGLLFDETGDRLTPTHSTKARKRSGYYISARLGTQRKGDADPGGWRLPRKELEAAVEEELRRVLRTDDVLRAGLSVSGTTKEVADLLYAARRLARAYDAMPFGERRTLIAAAIPSITITPGTLRFTINPRALVACLLDQSPALSEATETDLHHTERAFRLRRRGVETKVVLTGDHPQKRVPEPSLVALILRAHSYLNAITKPSRPTLAQVAIDHEVPASEVSRILPLAFLDPMITKAILDGSQPPTLTVDALTRLTDLPLAWSQQRKALGM
jgi:DNA invertase Pin-like site-specific DNA recombinase